MTTNSPLVLTAIGRRRLSVAAVHQLIGRPLDDEMVGRLMQRQVSRERLDVFLLKGRENDYVDGRKANRGGGG